VSGGTAIGSRVDRLEVAVRTIPTDAPEADGTLEWSATTVVLVKAYAGGREGLGFSYTAAGAASVVTDLLAPVVRGRDAMDVAGSWAAMWQAIRNVGQTGIAATAVAAVDVALWDLKARLLEVPLVVALDAVRTDVAAYGSGGFCSYSDEQLTAQLSGWVEEGLSAVKIKTGREPERDQHRLRVAREAIGDSVELYVDANGAFSRSQARAWSEVYAGHGVRWFEEPVTSDDPVGLREVRSHAAAPVEIAAGEYGWGLPDFRRLLEAEAVDCLQADVTRCGGITGFLRVGALCAAHSMDLSAHCAPQLSAHALAAVPRARHVEWFHDHVRIESMLFDGCLTPYGGRLVPDRSRPGHGLHLREDSANRFV